MRKKLLGLLVIPLAFACSESKKTPTTGNEIKQAQSSPEANAALDKIANEVEVSDAASYARRATQFLRAGEELQLGASAYERAITDFQKSIELDPSESTTYSNLGMAYVRLNKPKIAIAHFSKAISINPKEVRFYISRGSAHARSGDDTMAVADLTKALELAPNDRVMFNRANAYTRLGDKKSAAADFRTIIETTKNPQVKADAQGNLEALEE